LWVVAVGLHTFTFGWLYVLALHTFFCVTCCALRTPALVEHVTLSSFVLAVGWFYTLLYVGLHFHTHTPDGRLPVYVWLRLGSCIHLRCVAQLHALRFFTLPLVYTTFTVWLLRLRLKFSCPVVWFTRLRFYVCGHVYGLRFVHTFWVGLRLFGYNVLVILHTHHYRLRFHLVRWLVALVNYLRLPVVRSTDAPHFVTAWLRALLVSYGSRLCVTRYVMQFTVGLVPSLIPITIPPPR